MYSDFYRLGLYHNKTCGTLAKFIMKSKQKKPDHNSNMIWFNFRLSEVYVFDSFSEYIYMNRLVVFIVEYRVLNRIMKT